MPVLYYWNGNVDNMKSDIGAEKDEHFIKLTILSNWRYFRLPLFLIFKHSDNRSTLQWRHMSAMASGLTGDLIIQQLVQSDDRAESKNRVMGGLPHKANLLSHPDDIGLYRKSSGWHPAMSISHFDEIVPMAKAPGRLRVNLPFCHLDDSGCLQISPWSLPALAMSPLTHANEIRTRSHPVSLDYRMVYRSIVCHPDDLTEVDISSGWVTVMLFVIRMTYASFLKSSGWGSKFRLYTRRGGPSMLPYATTIDSFFADY